MKDLNVTNQPGSLTQAIQAELGTQSTPRFDPAHLRLSQNFGESASVKKRITVISIRKPGKQEFIRVHPDPAFCLQTAVLDLKEEGEVYLVDPSLWDQLPEELVAKVLYVTITRQGTVRLWVIRLPDAEGKLDDWNQSALEAAEIAKRRWVRVSSNRSAGMYDTLEASAALPEPEWPDLTFSQILEIAFGNGRYITDLNHPALQKLRGVI